jgi:hypothetical protein
MKKLLAVLVICGLLVSVAGCPTPTTPKAPGPKTVEKKTEEKKTEEKKTEEKAVVPPKGITLTPTAAATVKPGAAVDVTISLAEAAPEDVKLEIAELPKGVTTDPATPKIEKGQKDAKLKVKADDKAEEGKKTIKFKATPAKGEPVDGSFDVEVKK